ncbi:MAG: hypothetical protein PHR07_08345 [Acidaminococcaceae bacterium]|nr:hypothetical protein [Acidaminococcaceae bacterium]
MGVIYVPSKGVSSWKELLADPTKHWKEGCSAIELAKAWESASGFPHEVEQIFAKSGNDLFQDIEILYAFPEFKVSILGGSKASQNDLYVLGKGAKGTVVIMVEGKVREDFGPLIKEKVDKGQATKRLEFLRKKLAISDKKNIDNIHYQLLHRTASAILEAERVGAKAAVMLVHSFDFNRAHFDDFAQFVSLYGVKAVPDKIIGPIIGKGSAMPVYVAWCSGGKLKSEKNSKIKSR